MIFGQDVFTAADAIHEKIAYVPGETNVWDNMRGGDILALFAKLRKNVNLDKQAELIQAFHFDVNKKAKAYSKGNKQKIALISALATEADLYIFDEPTSGLDPLMENVFQTEVKRLKQAGKAILLSSHILSEVEKLADTIVIIKDGEIIERGSLQELKSITQSKMIVTTKTELSGLRDFSSVSQLQISGNTATFLLDDAEQGVLPACQPMAGFVRIAFTHAFYHLLRETTFVLALRQVLAGGGDTDTNACIVGGLVGAHVGLAGIPESMSRAVLTCDTAKGRPRPPWLRTKDAVNVEDTRHRTCRYLT